jgi:hypothetical protein
VPQKLVEECHKPFSAGQNKDAQAIISKYKASQALRDNDAASIVVRLVDQQRHIHFNEPFSTSGKDPSNRFIPQNEREKYRFTA